MNIQLAQMELIEMLLSTRKIEVLKKVKELLEENHDRLTEEDYAIIDQRRDNHLNGISKSFSWEDGKKMVRNK
jgi:hypothetical protein